MLQNGILNATAASYPLLKAQIRKNMQIQGVKTFKVHPVANLFAGIAHLVRQRRLDRFGDS